MRRTTLLAPIVLAGLLIGPGLAAAAPARTSGSSPGGLSLTATPAGGPAPLKVLFVLTSGNGTPPTLRWAFGDGSYLNGSGSSVGAPYHLYPLPGHYRCTVTAVWPGGSANDSIGVDVTAILTVTATAAPEAGAPPLTVWFNGTVSGGSGTWISYLWAFGDGGSGSGLSLRYTYASAGHYTATLTVIDSLNRSAEGSVVVNVAAASVRSSGAPPFLELTDPLVAVLAAAGVAAIVGSGLWLRRNRSSGRFPPSTPPAPAPVEPGSRHDPGPEPLASPPLVAQPVIRTAGPAEALEPGPSDASTPRDRPATLTLQILRHLAGLPRVGPDTPVVPREFTQTGMSEALASGQSAVSRVLRRLVAAGVIEVATRHVAGSDRRMRVYWLTDRGERLGRALREAPNLGGAARKPGPPN